jgi:outer membrane protein
MQAQTLIQSLRQCAVLFCIVGTVSAAEIEVDLRTALERAPQANFEVLLMREGLTAQTEAVRAARSGLLPQVTLGITQARAMSPNVDAFTSSFPGVPKRFFNDRFDGVLRARMAIYSSRTLDDWRLSQKRLEATRHELDDTIQVIYEQIALAYFSHWRNQRRLAVIDANLERDRLLLRIAQDQNAAGVATALDVTRAEVRLATNELARLQQETALVDSSLRLKRILNYPLGAQLVIREEAVGTLEPAGFGAARFEEVLRARADYRKRMTEVEGEALALKASRRDRLPSVAVSGQWGVASQSWTDDMEEQWGIELGVSMPIFEGFRLDAQEQAAASALRSSELALDNLKAQIEAEYRLVLQSIASRGQQVEVAQRTVALSEREFELARIRFEEGVADNSDVVTAQAALADAEDRLVEAEFQYLQSRANLARIEGDVRRILD